jgi:hypothetical protein
MVLSKQGYKMVMACLVFKLSSLLPVESTPSSSEFRPAPVLLDRTLDATSTVSTTNCEKMRSEPYSAELQLVYEYSAEFEAGKTKTLTGLEAAVAHAVASELDMCDDFGRPLYKVKTNTRHGYSKTGTWKIALPVGMAAASDGFLHGNLRTCFSSRCLSLF